MATFMKLQSGDWGIRGTGFIPGAAVQVRKANGDVKTVYVQSVISVDANGIQIASIAGSKKSGSTSRRSYSRSRFGGGYSGCKCGVCGAGGQDRGDVCDHCGNIA